MYNIKQLIDKPGVNASTLGKLFTVCPAPECRHYCPQPEVVGMQRIGIKISITAPASIFPEKRFFPKLEASNCFLQGCFEAPVNRHDFAGSLHLPPCAT